METVIGIDIGTQSTKALVLDGKGQILAEHSRGYRVDTPHPLWAEQWEMCGGRRCSTAFATAWVTRGSTLSMSKDYASAASTAVRASRSTLKSDPYIPA